MIRIFLRLAAMAILIFFAAVLFTACGGGEEPDQEPDPEFVGPPPLPPRFDCSIPGMCT